MNTPLPDNSSDVVPVALDPLCPQCDYNLRDLRESRCPECGNAFTREEVQAYATSRHAFHFEFQARRHPISSLLRTTTALLRPRRFWEVIPAPLPVYRRRLFLQLCITLMACGVLSIVSRAVLRSIEWSLLPGGLVMARVNYAFEFKRLFEQSIPAVIFVVLIWISVWALRKTGWFGDGGNGNMIRAFGYSSITLAIYALMGGVLSNLVSFVEDYFFSVLQMIHPDHLETYAGVISFSLCLRYGLAREVNVERPWVLVITVLLMTALMIHGLIYASGMIWQNYSWSGNPIVRWFTYAIDPFWYLAW